MQCTGCINWSTEHISAFRTTPALKQKCLISKKLRLFWKHQSVVGMWSSSICVDGSNSHLIVANSCSSAAIIIMYQPLVGPTTLLASISRYVYNHYRSDAAMWCNWLLHILHICLWIICVRSLARGVLEWCNWLMLELHMQHYHHHCPISNLSSIYKWFILMGTFVPKSTCIVQKAW